MPTLIVEDFPADIFAKLEKLAAEEQRSIPEETLHLLKTALRDRSEPSSRLPDFIPGEEISAPCDLPRSSQGVSVVAKQGIGRLPDFLMSTDSE